MKKFNLLKSNIKEIKNLLFILEKINIRYWCIQYIPKIIKVKKIEEQIRLLDSLKTSVMLKIQQ